MNLAENVADGGAMSVTWPYSRAVILAGVAGLTLVMTYFLAHTVFGTLLNDILLYLFIWGAAATAWALHAGPAGRLSIGHAAFFGIGAYSVILFQASLGMSVWFAFPFALLVTALLGALLELVLGRLHGIYYALATFAFAQLVWLIARSWRDVTGGTAGVNVPFSPEQGLAGLMFQETAGYVVLAEAVLLLSLGICWAVTNSRIGYFVRALRDAPSAAAAIGLTPRKWRAGTAGLSAGLTSLAGAVFAQHLLFVDPDAVLSFRISLLIMLPAIFGGINVPYGSLVGAALIVPLRQWLLAGGIRMLEGLEWLAYGVVFIVVVLILPEGIVDFARYRAWPRLRAWIRNTASGAFRSD